VSNVIHLPKRVRPLRKTYQPGAPYEVEREDADSGEIYYHVVDMRPDSYRTVCSKGDDRGHDPFAKHDATEVARGLNLLVQYGLETNMPKPRKTFLDLDEDELPHAPWDERAEQEEEDYE